MSEGAKGGKGIDGRSARSVIDEKKPVPTISYNFPVFSDFMRRGTVPKRMILPGLFLYPIGSQSLKPRA